MSTKDQNTKSVKPVPFLGILPKTKVPDSEPTATETPVLPVSPVPVAPGDESVSLDSVTPAVAPDEPEPVMALVSPLSDEPPPETGNPGETGADQPTTDLSHVTNAEFVAAIFDALPEGAVPIVCAKPGDPEQGGWYPKPGAAVATTCLATENTYFNCSSVYPDETGKVAARKDTTAAFHLLMLDDVGTKVDRNRLAGFTPTYELETSPGNFQVGIKLNAPLTDPKKMEYLQKTVATAGLCDKGALGAARWARLPQGINGKRKHRTDKGKPFQCSLKVWNPELAYTVEQIIEQLVPQAPALANLPALQPAKVLPESREVVVPQGNGIFTPRAAENPVITALREQGLYKRELSPGVHDITCPWVQEHTDALDSGTAYFEPGGQYSNGGFCCQHSHRDQYHISHLIEYLGITAQLARHKLLVQLQQGEMHRIVAASEMVLSEAGDFYQLGGVIVRVVTEPTTGLLTVKVSRRPGIATALSGQADWEQFDKRSKKWVRCDPPERVVAALYEAESYSHLPPLIGLAQQPFYRADGQLVMTPGYDRISMRIGDFDAAKYASIGRTREAAQAALALLLGLLEEFPFATEADRAVAVSALFTAALRPSLDLAPGYNVSAPTWGGGKSYLCEVIGLFASAGIPARISYPKTQEEAGKTILALLLTSPPVIEFDDMDGDWKAHSVVNSLFTSPTITGRILGVNKTATVSTCALVLGSGNNVEPSRDLKRRVVPIRLDPACANPALRQFKGNPRAAVKADRERYVCAVLTVVEAWKAAGSPKTALPNVASFGGAWTDYCRHPLVWLGLPDPAKALVEQIRHDPEAEQHGLFLREWVRVLGTGPIAVRSFVAAAHDDEELHEAVMALPVSDGRTINRGKLGWYLKANIGRIVDGLTVRRVDQASRPAWRVECVGEPVSPVLSVSSGTASENGSDDGIAF